MCCATGIGVRIRTSMSDPFNGVLGAVHSLMRRCLVDNFAAGAASSVTTEAEVMMGSTASFFDFCSLVRVAAKR